MQSICDDQCEIGCFDSTRVVLPLHCIRIASSGAYVNLNQPSSYAVSPPAPQPQRLSTHGFPPPPPQLTRSTYVPPPPAQDPYASLGLFTSPQSNSPAVRQPSAPPPPPSQKPPSQPSHSYTKQGYSGSSTFPAPPPPPPGVGTRISSQHQPISPPAPQGYNNQYKYGYGR